MKSAAKLLLISAPFLILAACSKDESQSSDPSQDAAEVLQRTISDDMISLDQIGVDGTAIDSSVPKDSGSGPAPKKNDAEVDEEAPENPNSAATSQSQPAPANNATTAAPTSSDTTASSAN